MASEKNLHHFCFWHPPLFNFYIVIRLPGTKEIFLPDGLKTFLLQLASPLTTTQLCTHNTDSTTITGIACMYSAAIVRHLINQSKIETN